LISIKGIGVECGHAMNQRQAHAPSTANNDAGARARPSRDTLP
jgi:hypothetical protein